MKHMLYRYIKRNFLLLSMVPTIVLVVCLLRFFNDDQILICWNIYKFLFVVLILFLILRLTLFYKNEFREKVREIKERVELVFLHIAFMIILCYPIFVFLGDSFRFFLVQPLASLLLSLLIFFNLLMSLVILLSIRNIGVKKRTTKIIENTKDVEKRANIIEQIIQLISDSIELFQYFYKREKDNIEDVDFHSSEISDLSYYKNIFEKGNGIFFECNNYTTIVKMKNGEKFAENDYFNWIYKDRNPQNDNNPTVTDFLVFITYLANHIDKKSHQLKINLIKDRVKINGLITRDKKDKEIIDFQKEIHIYSKLGTDAIKAEDRKLEIKNLFE